MGGVCVWGGRVAIRDSARSASAVSAMPDSDLWRPLQAGSAPLAQTRPASDPEAPPPLRYPRAFPSPGAEALPVACHGGDESQRPRRPRRDDPGARGS